MLVGVLCTIAVIVPRELQMQRGNQSLLTENADDSYNPSDPEGVQHFAAS
jgi:hypothetical protein